MRTTAVAVLAASIAARCTSGPEPASSAASSAPPPTAPSAAPSVEVAACSRPIPIYAAIDGRFEGSPSDAYKMPVLVVAARWQGGIPPDGVVARVPLAAPWFAAEYKLSDLCTDAGSNEGRIAITCLGPEARPTGLVVTRDGGDLLVQQGQEPGTRWIPPPGLRGCFELHGLEARADLEPLRRTWGLDEPSARCAGDNGKPKTKLTLLLTPAREHGACFGRAGTAAARVSLLVPSQAPRDLGLMGNLCGGLTVTRFDDANRIQISASDMGTEVRFAYALGDRLYYLGAEGHVSAMNLPCGARTAYEVAGLPARDAANETRRLR